MARRLSCTRKEIVSIILIILGVFCLVFAVLLMTVFMFPTDGLAFMYQCSLVGAAIFAFFFACGTWFYNSNLKRHRKHARIYLVTLMFVHCASLLVTDALFTWRFAGKICGYFEPAILDFRDYIIIWIAAGGGVLCAIGLLAVNIWLIRNKIKRHRPLQRRLRFH